MSKKITPMMQQWHDCKKKAKDALLLFRLGDFYEAFYDDAKLLAKDLQLTLTKRGDIPMSGIPAHTAESYIEKLIHKGHLVALAEQVEDPKDVKGIVKREVVKRISPGCVYNPNLLKDKSYNFFAALVFEKKKFALSLLDLSTGLFQCLEVDSEKSLLEELSKTCPSELLISKRFEKHFPSLLEDIQISTNTKICVKETYHFDPILCEDFLKDQFNMPTLDGFGLKDFPLAITASGALLTHLKNELFQELSHVKSLKPLTTTSYLSLDQTTLRNLEILSPSTPSSKPLLEVIDCTVTPMGARLLKGFVTHPLLDETSIQDRLNATEELLGFRPRLDLLDNLSKIKDLERLLTRIETKHHSPQDVWALKESLVPLPDISNTIQKLSHPLFERVRFNLKDLSALTQLIENTLTENPPAKNFTGNLIKKGIDSRLDELKSLKENSQKFLLKYQERLREETGIKTLKVSFNKAFGYFIEVSRGQSKNMPSSFHKRQTLVNNERFISDELQKFESDILNAEENISKLEMQLYSELRHSILTYNQALRDVASAIAHLDCYLAFSELASQKGYVKPQVDASDTLHIERGRHPVIEKADPSLNFIPNDTLLDSSDRLFLITGPNMAGKSTYIRQVALITIMAQIGLYVPAVKAHIGVVDKVFTRIGASDDLSKGQSTFMVEMTETAHILNNATHRSLVILDEIGRGTSTYDGISIAWSVAEYLLKTPSKKSKTLFATHYFELTEMEGKIPGAVNYNISVKETENGIIFLRKILKGAADRSYGIHVAALAGLPKEVLTKAAAMLKSLEKSPQATKNPKNSLEPSLFDLPLKKDQKVLDKLKKLSIDHLSPMQAFEALRDVLQEI